MTRLRALLPVAILLTGALVSACVPPAPPAPAPPPATSPPSAAPPPATAPEPVPNTASCATATSAPTQPASTPSPDTLSVSEAAAAAETAAEQAGHVTVVVTTGGRPEAVTIPAEDAVDVAVDAAGQGRLTAVETPIAAVVQGTASAAATDPLVRDQWGLTWSRFSGAWACSTGAGQLVAVLDTGVNASHPDLAGKITVGPAFLNNNPTGIPGGGGADSSGHGTHVAGIVAANHNTIGVAGAAPAARVLSIKVIGDDGIGWSTDAANGITAAVDAGATVINCSFAGTGMSSAVASAVAYANRRGVVVVAASGNNGPTSAPMWPASTPGVIAVGGHDASRGIASWSSWGTHVAVSAPGDRILSTVPGGYGYMSGTSMASPHVAALAALLRAAKPTASPADIRSLIVSSAVDAGAPGRDNAHGAGTVDALSALRK